MKKLTIILISLLVITSCTTTKTELMPNRIEHKAKEPSKKTVEWVVENAPEDVKKDIARMKLDARIANATNEVEEPSTVKNVKHWYSKAADVIIDAAKTVGSWLNPFNWLSKEKKND